MKEELPKKEMNKQKVFCFYCYLHGKKTVIPKGKYGSIVHCSYCGAEHTIVWK